MKQKSIPLPLSQDHISELSHTINNALASLLAYIQLSRRAQENSHWDRAKETTIKLEHQAHLLTSMLADIHWLAKIYRAPLHLQLTEFELREVLEPIISRLSRQYPEVRFTVQAQPTRYWGDQEKIIYALERILLILSLLLKHRGRIAIKVKEHEQEMLIQIQASPLTLVPTIVPAWFTPFSLQEILPGNTHSGLELVLAKYLIGAHQGTIQEEHDTTSLSFLLTLPRHQ
jgi:light-regulated signal transduction histidine kinase (bacteriophytochrome)